MKQLTTHAEIVAALNLEADIFVTSARQNGSTLTGDKLTSIIANEGNRLVRTENTQTGDIELTKLVTSESEQPTVNVYVQSGAVCVHVVPNHVHSWLGESVLTWLIVNKEGLFFVHWEGTQIDGSPRKAYDVIMTEDTQHGVSLDFLGFRQNREGFDIVQRIMAPLDSRKPITIIGRRPHQGASTFTGCLATALAARNGLSVSLYSQLNEPAVLRGIRFEGVEGLDEVVIKHDPCHFAAGMETVQRVEYEMSSRLEKEALAVILIDELVPHFEVPGVARANPVSADIFSSSAQIRFATKVQEQLAEKTQALGIYAFITGSSANPGDLTIAPNTIVTYLAGKVLSVLSIGERGYSVAHLRLEHDDSLSRVSLVNAVGDNAPDFSEVAEDFHGDVSNVIRYFKDLEASKEFERDSAEISAEAEREANKPKLSGGLR